MFKSRIIATIKTPAVFPQHPEKEEVRTRIDYDFPSQETLDDHAVGVLHLWENLTTDIFPNYPWPRVRCTVTFEYYPERVRSGVPSYVGKKEVIVPVACDAPSIWGHVFRHLPQPASWEGTPSRRFAVMSPDTALPAAA